MEFQPRKVITVSELSSAEILSLLTGLPQEQFKCDVEDYPSLDELQGVEAENIVSRCSENPDYTLYCGGREDDEHMVNMEFNSDAATPHWVCPKCGSRSWVHEEQVVLL